MARTIGSGDSGTSCARAPGALETVRSSAAAAAARKSPNGDLNIDAVLPEI
jgi:hypothetical protein